MVKYYRLEVASKGSKTVSADPAADGSDSTCHIEDLIYNIKPKKSTKNEEKVILNGVSCLVQTAEILAILGSFESGETTLLSDAITYNNKPFSNPVKRNNGFVTQDNFPVLPLRARSSSSSSIASAMSSTSLPSQN
ncbi:hypothetical protein CerSpe_269920 [Prunus speciosa]